MITNNSLTNIGGFSALILIFLALFVPTTYSEIKASLLLVSCVIAFFLVLLKGAKISKKLFYSILTLTLVGLFYSVLGLINDAPGAVRVLTIFFVWPWVYFLLSVYLSMPRSIEFVFSTMVLALVCIVFYGYLFLGYSANLIPDYLYFQLDQGQSVGFYDGFVEYNLYSIASLLILMPLLLHYIYIKFKTDDPKRMINLFILALAVAPLSILTGRRAIILILIITPILIFVTHTMLSANLNGDRWRIRSILKRPFFYIFILLSFIFIIYFPLKAELSIHSIWEMFGEGFDFSSGKSATERTEQFHSLVESWLNGNILFGAGNGAASNVVRSEEMPWSYELTYIYLLFSTGVLGVLFYFSWFGYGLLRLRKELVRRPDLKIYVFPMITGVFGLVVGAATNPYFGKFDYLWVIIFPHLLAGGLKYQRRIVKVL